MFAVVITEKGGQQRRLDFDKNEVTIGRVQGNDIILPKGNVSKRHSRIVLKDNRFIVVDLKSTNGTYVNGRKITSPLVVKAGDKIYIGDFILTLEENAGMGAVMGGGGFEPAQPSPAPLPGPAPMTSPPPVGPPPGPPPMTAPAPQPQRPSAAPPPMPRPGPPPPMPAPAPAHMAPPMPPAPMPGPPMAAPPMPAPVPPMPAPAPPMPAPAPPMPAPAPPMPIAAPPMPAPAPPMPAPAPPMPPVHAAPPMPAPPMPAPPAPMPAPMPMAGGAAERFPLDEEPAGMDDRSPSPRVVSSSHGMPPAPMPVAPVPPAPSPPVAPVAVAPAPMPAAPSASAAPTPAATPRAMAPKGAQSALSAVVSQAARTFNPYDVTSPAGDGDPRRDAARRAVDAAVDAAAKSGPSFDRERVGAAAVEELVGLGALSALLASPSVREIVVQGPGSVLVDQGQGLAPGDGYFSSAEALSVIVGRLVALAGGQHDGGAARHEGLLPSGFHFTALMAPVAVGGPIVELRRVTGRSQTADQLVARGMLSNDMLEVLRRATRARKAIVVIGAADAGVSACVSGLANLVGEDERVIVVEGSPTLELASSNVVRLTATAGVSLEELITHGGRMRGDRIVIDGVRGPETLGALLTVASRNGSVLGVHSAPGGDTLGYLSALARLGGSNPEALGRILPSAASVLVRVGRGADGRARVESLSEVRHGGGGAQVVDLFGANFASTGQSPSF